MMKAYGREASNPIKKNRMSLISSFKTTVIRSVFLIFIFGMPAICSSADGNGVIDVPSRSSTGRFDIKFSHYGPPGASYKVEVYRNGEHVERISHSTLLNYVPVKEHLADGYYPYTVGQTGNWRFQYCTYDAPPPDPDPDPGPCWPGDPICPDPLFMETMSYGWQCQSTHSDSVVVSKPIEKPKFDTPIPSEKDAADGRYSISWNRPSTTTKFKLQEKVDSTGTFKNVTLAKKDATSYTPPKKSRGHTYFYRLKACNNLQCSNGWTHAAVKVLKNEEPSIAWIESPHGGTFRPDELPTMYVKATDLNGIRSVYFYRDNGSDSGRYSLGKATPDNGRCSGCFRSNWTSSPQGEGIKIWAEAKDNLGAVALSSEAKVDVLANAAPSGWLTSPPDSVDQYESVTLTAEASDSDGSVSSVEFLLDDATLGVDDTAPYQIPWTPEDAGSFQLKVRVTDNEGLDHPSREYPVTVVALERPDPPAGLNIDGSSRPVPDNTTGNYTVEWETETNADTYALEQLRVGIDEDFQPVELADEEVPGQYFPNQAAGSYRYLAYACNRAGCSDPSDEIAIDVVKEAPKSPEDLSATAVPQSEALTGEYRLEWKSIEEGPLPDYYELWEKVGGPESSNNWENLEPNDSNTRFLIPSKEPGTYSYYVKACNAFDCSESSEVLTITVLPPRLLAAALACDGTCISLSGHGFDPNTSLTLTAVHDPSVKQTFSTGDFDLLSSTEMQIPIQLDGELYDALFELGVRATVVNPNGARGGITVYGNRATEIIGETQSAPALASDGTLYVGAGEKLYALDANDGSVKPAWPFTAGGVIKASPRVDGVDGTVYVGSLDHSLYAVTPDAIQKWRLETGGEIVSSAVLDEDRVLYFGSMDGVLYAVNAPNGSVKWTFPANGGIAKSPVLAGDNTLYFTTVEDSQVYAIPRGVEGPGKLVWESVDDSLIWKEIGEWQPGPSQKSEFLSIARLYRGLLQPPLPFSKKVLTFWTYQLIGGSSKVDIAEAFLESDTGRTNFSPNQGNGAFIDALYERMLPGQDQLQLTWGGVAYSRAMLLDMLQSDYSRAQIAVLFTQSLEYTAATSALLGHGFDYLYDQDYSWAVTERDEGKEYTRDCDADGLPDWWEILYFSHTDYDGEADPDGDDTTNEEAFEGKTSPCAAGCYNGIGDEPPAPADAPYLDPLELKMSSETGSLPGEFRVNEAGAATYSIPLSLPVGTGGVAPDLALEYSSQGGNGILGQGWNLKGLSAISRCRKTLGQDGESAPITWGADDRFCLDGQRLLLVGGGNYGDPGSQYRTEVDSYLLVTARGGTAGKPGYFTVERKDGSISYYGRGNKSRQTVAGSGTLNWAVSRYEDSAGNGIEFVYAKNGGHRIREIRYAYGDGNTPGAKVAFDYEGRTDKVRGYLAGALLATDKRMTEIEVHGDNNMLLRRYEFDYLESDHDYLSRIERIRECAGGECRPDTIFEWRLPAIHFTPDYTTSVQLSSQRDRAAISPRPVDINGDGRLDLIWQEPDWYEDGSGKIAFQIWKYVLATDDGFGPEEVAFQDGANVRNPYRWEMLDHNADGRADLAVYIKGEERWKIFRSSVGTDDWFFTYPFGGDGDDTPITDENTRFVDINSDGLADAVYSDGYRLLKRDIDQPENQSDIYHFGEEHTWQIEGLESWGEIDETYESVSQYLNPDIAGDFDGDGRIDLVLMDTKQVWEQVGLGLELGEQHTRAYVVKVEGDRLVAGEKLLDFVQAEGFDGKNRETDASPYDRHRDLEQKLLSSDINSDGLADLLLANDDSYRYKLSTGMGFAPHVPLGDFPEDVHFNWFDYEGDGDADLAWRREDENGVYDRVMVRRWQSHSQEFSSEEIALTLKKTRKGGQDIFVDMNGDGSTDYLEFHNDTLYIYHSPDRRVAPNVIEGITNGLGAETRIEYDSTVSSGHYARLGIQGVGGDGCWQTEDANTFSTGTENWCQQYQMEDGHAFYTELNRNWSGSHSLGKTGPVLEQLGAQFLVTRVESSAPAANDEPGDVDYDARSAISYFYGRALLQAGGRGLLGFHEIRTVDEQSGIETTTSYRQDYPFQGRPLRTEVRSQDGMLLSEAENTWQLQGWKSTWPDSVQEGTAALGPLKPYIAESVEKAYELESNGQREGDLLKTVTTTTEQDAHGNPTSIVVTTEAANGDTFETETVNEYVVGGGARSVTFNNPEHGFNGYPELGRILSTTVTHRRTEGGESDSAIRKSGFSYYDNGNEAGLLKEEIVEPGDERLRLATRYEYDRFGNKVLAEQSAANEETRLQRWIYDVTGRFIEREENSYGQTTSRVLERDNYGQPTLVEDIAGVQTTFSYDPFGRQVLEYSATGAHKIGLFGSAGSQCPSGAIYQRTERKGGGSEVITCFDSLAREVRVATLAFDGGWNYVDTEYDSRGKIKHKSEPYKAGGSNYWQTQYYDRMGRVIGTDLPGVDGTNGTDFDIAVQYDGYASITTNPAGQVHREVKNAVDEKIRVRDNLGNIQEFKHDAQGNLRFVINKGDGSRNLRTEMDYDLRGRKIYMSDPDKGEWHYKYNAYGDLVEQIDAKEQRVINNYDRLGRLEERIDVDESGNTVETTLWGYNNEAVADAYGTPPGALREVMELESGFIKLHSYDSYGRPTETVTSLSDGDDHYELTNYDDYSRPFQVFDAGGDGSWESSAVQYEYKFGYLEQVIDAEQVNLASGEQFYTVLNMDARGNVTKYVNGNGVTTEKTYDPATGRLLGQSAHVLGAAEIQSLAYHWDDLGNLEYREDNSGDKKLQEDFTYDDLNRLESATVSGRETQSVKYDGLGNIIHKSDVGDYYYGSDCREAAGPHAVCETSDGVSYEYDANGNMVSDSSGRSLKYTTFDKPSEISKDGHKTEFQYGPDRKRYLRIDTDGNGQVTETRYIGSVEKVTRNGVTEIKRYLPGGALVTVSGGERESQYLHKDHLGSLDVITNGDGQIARDDNNRQLVFSFDAWGQRRNALDWSELLSGALVGFDASITTRGFTGHEMLDQVGLIHMNGRIYDPRLAKFLQADPFVQEPGYSQSHNRYAYVWNNPLNATDPSGYFVGFTLIATIALAAAETTVVWYVAGGIMAAAGFMDALAQGATASQALQGGLIAGVSAAAFAGIGEYLSGGFEGSFAAGLSGEGFALKLGLHGLAGGVMSELQGGKFGHGFAAAGLTALGTSFNNSNHIGGEGFSMGRVAIGSVIGGTASKVSGGKFANGAATGAFSQALNNEMSEQRNYEASQKKHELTPQERAEAVEALREHAVDIAKRIRNKDQSVWDELLVDSNSNLEKIKAGVSLQGVGTKALSAEVSADMQDLAVVPLEIGKKLVASKGNWAKALGAVAVERVYNSSKFSVSTFIACPEGACEGTLYFKMTL
ncbi:PQQ-binding-like beta-propeller repeat protein [Microbulbifer halophilus]|uniref:PQQ-binding-like beta-propeller repeat protein n=2 Tax=Microbulbifer halophilus TaxID=453963 RepID=A0ABW5ECR0_9GAMM|nr:PQQ-binding-like beta-propeller repeat protein [Microbulbifer halophilus]MCW8126990.1 PQQ-binding-like beta-propeller repeat protein [Microbulbifer halophilus]